ncbi:hypothetical protein VPHK469_0097 [Vibrio phage K469]
MIDWNVLGLTLTVMVLAIVANDLIGYGGKVFKENKILGVISCVLGMIVSGSAFILMNSAMTN